MLETTVYCTGDDCGCRKIDFDNNEPFNVEEYRKFAEDLSPELIESNIEYYLSDEHKANNQVVGIDLCLECSEISECIVSRGRGYTLLCFECKREFYEEYLILMTSAYRKALKLKKHNCAKKIQRQLRKSMYDPQYKMCRSIMKKHYKEIGNTSQLITY
jgi:hypothetical protein